ncbi:hypothetical protein [Kribbella sp. C-35]|uniref:hypothetical protein n=1 Tax=Kribbella sp. C-35 TaxID=2789276 RepID=UPI0039783C9D
MRVAPWPLAATTALLTACSAIPQADTVESLTRPAITTESAQSVVKHYNDVNNAANRRRDDMLIATVEGGNLLRQSRAAFTIERAVDKANKNFKPFFLTDSVVGAPAYGTYPMRFVTKSAASNSNDYVQVGVWERRSAGEPWMHTFTQWVPTATKLPDLNGLREIGPTDASRWSAAPGTVANQLASYLTIGAKSPDATTFAPSKPISDILAQVADAKSMAVQQPKQYRKVSNTFTVTGQPVSFATPSGEALVLLTLNDEYRVDIGSGYQVSWTSPELSAFSPATKYYENALTNVSLHDVVLVIPPKGSGKVRILAVGSQLVDAGGY